MPRVNRNIQQVGEAVGAMSVSESLGFSVGGVVGVTGALHDRVTLCLSEASRV